MFVYIKLGLHAKDLENIFNKGEEFQSPHNEESGKWLRCEFLIKENKLIFGKKESDSSVDKDNKDKPKKDVKREDKTTEGQKEYWKR